MQMGGVCFRSSSVNNSLDLQSPNLPEIYQSPLCKPFINVLPFSQGSTSEELEGNENSLNFETDGIPYTLDSNANGIREDNKLARVSSARGKSLKRKTTPVAWKKPAKINEVGFLLGRAGNIAVEALDTLGSSMTNLNLGSGFASGAAPKGNMIGILAFEVANTIVKGFNLKQSLSEENIRILKEETLHMEGIQWLISTDLDELLKLAAADKRNELKIFAGEVARFGNRCRDPQWHRLDRYFFSEKLQTEAIPMHSKEESEKDIQNLMKLAQNTAELYHELHALDRFETEYRRKVQDEQPFSSSQKGDSLSVLRSELKSQRRHVKELKKRSLWSKVLEEVVEKLVEFVDFINREIQDAFGDSGDISCVPKDDPKTESSHKLGAVGLALHYANLINQIDNIVANPTAVSASSRENLYQNLPPTITAKLRNRLQKFWVEEELTVPLIKAEMERILSWLVPMAGNTTKAHHGFGWVGEWANTGASFDSSLSRRQEFALVQTLHHADQKVTEEYILDLIVWLHHLVGVAQSNNGTAAGGNKSPFKSPPICSPVQVQRELSNEVGMSQICHSPRISQEDEEMLRRLKSRRKLTPGISKSQEFMTPVHPQKQLRKSSSYSTIRCTVEEYELPLSSRHHLPIVPLDFETDKMRALDVIDSIY